MLTAEVFKGEMSKYPGGYKLWYVRLVAENGEIVAVSEGYVTKWNAKRAANKNFPEAKLVVLDS
jgi:uncharacterized protein YegP (UPF0339 family)